MATKIYKLIHFTIPVYCGKTKRTLEQRFSEHMKKKNLPAHEYSIELILECSDEDASLYEDININALKTIENGLNKISAQGKLSATAKDFKLKQAEQNAKNSINNKH